MKNTTNVLAEEMETYLREKKKLLEQSVGKFVLIKKTTIEGIFESQNDAIKVGISKFGNNPFLVKKIEEIETPQNFTSNMLIVNC